MAESSLSDETQISQSPGPPLPGQRYRFTPEELRCIKECNRECFYYRCLPIGSAFSLGTYYAIRYGYLKPSPKLGAAPKIIFAALTGYFVGKFSYQARYVEKLMQLPNSPLGAMLRKQRESKLGGSGFGGFTEPLTMEPSFSTTGILPSSTPNQDDFSSSSYFSSQSIDVSDVRPMNDTYDGSEPYSRSYQENEHQMREDTLPPRPAQYNTTYDELRKQNREAYEKRLHSSSLQGVPETDTPSRDFSNPPSSPSSQLPSSQPQFRNPAPVRRNIYGDIMVDEKSF